MSDEEVVEQTNKLAGVFFRMLGYVVSSDYKFYRKEANGRSRLAWDLACEAQLELTKTDPQDALSALGMDGYGK